MIEPLRKQSVPIFAPASFSYSPHEVTYRFEHLDPDLTLPIMSETTAATVPPAAAPASKRKPRKRRRGPRKHGQKKAAGDSSSSDDSSSDDSDAGKKEAVKKPVVKRAKSESCELQMLLPVSWCEPELIVLHSIIVELFLFLVIILVILLRILIRFFFL